MEKYLDAAGLKTYTGIVKTQIEKSKQSVLDTKAQPNGIASLDGNGQVPLSQLGNVDNTLYEVVTSLPTSLADIGSLHNRKNHIFIVARTSATSQNSYKEYVYTGTVGDNGEVQDPTKWEELGEFTSEVDLQGYSKKVETICNTEVITIATADNTNAAGIKITYADGQTKTLSIPNAAKNDGTYTNGLMLGEDKEKLDKIDTDALEASIDNANNAADNANAAADKANTAADKADTAREKVVAALATIIPTGLEVEDVPRLTFGNLEPVYINAKLTPENTMQNIIYMSDNKSVQVGLDGRITVLAKGSSIVHVIPTCNVALAKTIVVSVGSPSMRLVTTRKQMRFTSSGAIRLN